MNVQFGKLMDVNSEQLKNAYSPIYEHNGKSIFFNPVHFSNAAYPTYEQLGKLTETNAVLKNASLPIYEQFGKEMVVNSEQNLNALVERDFMTPL